MSENTNDTQIDFNMLLVAFTSAFEALKLTIERKGKLSKKDLAEIQLFVDAVNNDKKLKTCLSIGIGLIKGDEE